MSPVPRELDRLRPVTSAQNALVKELRKAFARGEPTPEGAVAIDGVHLVEEALRSGLRVRALFVGQSAQARAERLLPQLAASVDILLLPDAVFAATVPTESPQGIAALVKLRPVSLDDLLTAPAPLFVVAVGLQDPGNLGTIIRSAEAFGATAVIAAEGCVAPTNSKVIRASAGSLFRLPVLRVKTADLLPRLRAAGFRLAATSSHKGTPLGEAALTGPLALLVGNEGAGLPRDLLRQVDETIVIPHSAHVESLNAGIAASILLYEASRQRKNL